jgi:hypothetical protein
MKQLKFSEPLPALVLGGTKTSTWRINDKKDIVNGDELSLCDNDGREFAKALAIDVLITTFGEMTDSDKEGHEAFANDEEMYATFSRYYNMEVSPKTNLKIIKFKLLA